MNYLWPPQLPIRRPMLIIVLIGVVAILLLATPITGSPVAAQDTTTTATPVPTLVPILGRVPITTSNAAQVKQLMQIGNGQATDACWSPDGKTIGVTSTIGLDLYDPAHPAQPERRLGPAADLSHCSWSPHSNYVTIINDNISARNPWSAQIWNISTGALFKSFEKVNQVIWSGDGHYFVTLDTDKHAAIWDGIKAQQLTQFSTEKISWSPDSRFAAFIDNKAVLQVWAVAAKSIISTDNSSKWTRIDWSPHKRWLSAMDAAGLIGLSAISPDKPQLAPVVRLSQLGFNDLSWSPDSDQLATAGKDNTLIVWNVVDHSSVWKVPFDSPVLQVAWSPAGQYIATIPGNVIEIASKIVTPITIYTQNINDGSSPDSWIYKVQWSPTGHYLMTSGPVMGEGNPPDLIDIFAPANSTAIAEGVLGKMAFATAGVTGDLSWSPEDKFFISGNWISGVVMQDDPISGGIKLGNYSFPSSFVTWSPNNAYLTWETIDSSVTFLRIMDGGLLKSQFYVSVFAWAPDSDNIAVGSFGQGLGSRLRVESAFGDTSSNVGEDIALSGEPGYRLPHQFTFSHDVQRVAFDNNNDGSYTVDVWDLNPLAFFEKLSGHSAPVNTVAFSPVGNIIASGSADKTIHLWDVASGQTIRVLSGHTESVNRVAFSLDGKFLASASDDQTVRIWDVTTGNLIKTLTGHAGAVTRVQWSPDGSLMASSSADGTIKLWEVSSGSLLTTLTGHTTSINDINWSPDGKTIASAGADATIRLWGVP